ncbi:MAG: hypothetical protein KC996_07890 [Phycisphaerales bacterium]|nr:hypothetical protein [Phycisphaerales bacterium]
MSRTRIVATIFTASLLAPSLGMSGCLIASNKKTDISGAYVQPGAVSRVRVNQTTAAEVEEIMGQPSFVTANDDGTETWNWNWTKTTGDSGAVFLVFAGRTEKTVAESVHIQMKDGVAIKKWRD